MIRSLQALRVLGEVATISAIVGFLFDEDAIVARETAAVIQSLFDRAPAELLLTLDVRIRADSYWDFPKDRWRTLAVDAIEHLHAGVSSALFLGMASCHGSGYIRQAAVERMDREVSSGAEIPFLLLRLDDWVFPVREAAEEAISRRLTTSHFDACVENLPLIFRLRSRLRASASAALARVETFLRTDGVALVRGALASGSRLARRYGVSLALQSASGADSVAHMIVERLIESEDPAVRLQGACWLASAMAAPELRIEFLPGLLKDGFAQVRRVALGWCAVREPGKHLAALRAGLLDPSCIVRSLAQFHLPKLEAIDLRSFYRDALNKRENRTVRGALGGLGETGRATDADLVLTFIQAPQPSVRKAALAALGKLALEEHREIFVDALRGSSPGVSRQARMMLERRASSVGADRLAAIFKETNRPHVRRQALCLIDCLGKWQKLPLLIEIFDGPDASTRKMVESLLRSWLWNFNRTHQVQPDKAEIARLRVAIGAHGSKIGGELRAIAESL